MAKKTKNIKQKPKSRRARNRMVGLLDPAARDYVNLLLDPCGARLTSPVYTAMGTGYFRRTRTIINLPATAVEGVYVFQPGSGGYWSSTTNAPGSNLTLGFTAFSGLFASGDTDFRCIAGCAKVRYLGTENNRSGQVGLVTVPGPFFTAGSVTTAETALRWCPMVSRTGEVQHEVKFVPGAGDESFRAVTTGSVSVCGSMGIVFTGVPAGSLTIELTLVYEQDSLTGSVMSSVPPASNNTLGQVLHSLGDVGQWAYVNVFAPVVKSYAGAVARSVMNAAASSVPRVRMVTL